MNFIKEKIDMSAFDDFSLISYQRFEKFKPVLEMRQTKGYVTEFEHQDIEKRIDPALVFSACESMLCVIKHYQKPITRHALKNEGYLSDLACVDDYHDVLKRCLLDVVKQLKHHFDFDYQIVIDTSPLLDQAIAYHAGLGFIGKNHLLIHPRLGTQIVIGTLLLSLKTNQTNPVPLTCQCHNCNLCIDYCPTKALISAQEINPKKCISYLSQTANEIDLDLQTKMHQSLYGCDICQKICPFERNSIKPNDAIFRVLENGTLDIKPLFTMSNRAYQKQFHQHAFSWRKKDIILRNGVIALANKKDIIANQLLVDNLQHSSAMIRSIIYDGLFRTRDCFINNKIILKQQLQFETDAQNKQKLLYFCASF